MIPIASVWMTRDSRGTSAEAGPSQWVAGVTAGVAAEVVAAV